MIGGYVDTFEVGAVLVAEVSLGQDGARLEVGVPTLCYISGYDDK